MNTREPQPSQDAPKRPSWVDGEVRKLWKRMVPALRQMGVLSSVDGEALAMFCQCYVRWRQAEDFLDQHGIAYPLRDERGNIKCMQQFPQVAVARNMLQMLKGFLQEFGLTPASRSRIELPFEPPYPVPGQRVATDRLGRPIWPPPGQKIITDRLGRPC